MTGYRPIETVGHTYSVGQIQKSIHRARSNAHNVVQMLHEFNATTHGVCYGNSVRSLPAVRRCQKGAVTVTLCAVTNNTVSNCIESSRRELNDIAFVLSYILVYTRFTGPLPWCLPHPPVMPFVCPGRPSPLVYSRPLSIARSVELPYGGHGVQEKDPLQL